tara:strand:- start:3051 stop:7667 length:4617 start_codon:yes stop_codon:yes gene_type:complete
MADFGLTTKQKSRYFSLEQRRTGFGELVQDFIGKRDYVHLFVSDLNDVSIGDRIIPLSEITNQNIPDINDTLKLNIGQHLREYFELFDGDYKVKYKFLRRVSGNSEADFIYDATGGIYTGEFIIENGLIYKVDEEGNKLDDGSELSSQNFSFQITENNPSRDEVLIEGNPQLGNDLGEALRSDLLKLNAEFVYNPLRVIESTEPRIKFQEDKFENQSFVLTIPENDTNGFTKSMEGDTIVFENFFRALIPTHYKGKSLAENSGRRSVGGSATTNLWKNLLVPGSIDESVFIPTDDYIVGANPKTIPFMQNVPSAFVSNQVTPDISNNQGYFRKDIIKNLNISSLDIIPASIWQTTDTGPKDGAFSGQVSGNNDFELKGTFPYRYSKTNDTDNIDLRGLLNVNEEYDSSNSTNVYIDWTTEVLDVINKNTIRVKANLKELYYQLRELGFKVNQIGNLEYRFPKQIEQLAYDEMFSENFYILEQLNNISDYKTYLKTIDNDFYLITNVKPFSDTGYYLKLQQPLQSRVIEDNQSVTIVEEVLFDYEDNISLIPIQTINDTFLLPANFDSAESEVQIRQTDYKSHDNLLGSDDEHNRKLERLLVSGSLLDVQPNIDYQKTTTDLSIERDDTGFGNFIHFSSAERRLNNFKTKLELIEGYTANSSSLVSVSSSLSKIQRIEKKRQRVIDSFTPYEDFLYFESSSYSSGSNGLFHDTSWPKTNSSSPYILEHSSGSTATTWYNNMILSASDYDFNNQNSLRNTLPEHVNQDTSNNVFLEFMDMVGEQFDETWTYVKSLTDVNMRVNNVSEGISKDVSKYYADALGIKLFNGNDLVGLSEYLLGKNTDGTDKNESSSEVLTEEIWKRVLSNLPFFIKSKGTKRALKGILNCYGIPSSVLRVREFGGPDKGTGVNFEIKRKFTRALDFKSSQYIKVPWKDTDSLKPKTIEFRFRSPAKKDQVMVQRDSNYAIQLINSASTEYGFVRFTVSASTGVSNLDTSKQRYFSDDMWSVMLTRVSSSTTQKDITEDSGTGDYIYELTAKQYDSTRQRIVFQTSSSIEIDGAVSSSYNNNFINDGNLFVGGSGSAFESQFSGSLMEFRLWSEALSQSIFDNHVRTPKAYNGNTTSSAYDNLLIRLPLDDNRNLQTSPTASNITYLKNYSGNISGSNVNGFTGNFYRSLVDQEKFRVPNVGFRRSATKIRLESNSLPDNAQLSPTQKQEQSSQDNAPIDSNKLGVYFSPTDVINEDIIYTLADFNLDNQIGDPRDEFENKYRGLSYTRNEYFKRYVGGHNHFFDYLRILDFYDDSVFEVLKQFVPARAKSDFGNLIEPNILERNKQQVKRKIQTTQPYYENANDTQVGIKVTRFISGSQDNNVRLFGEFPYYESVIAYSTGSVRGLNRATQVHINEINPRVVDSNAYATASITKGGTSIEFTETIQPFISGSRLSQFNKVKEFYYTSSLSVSTANGFGSTYEIPGNLYVWSSSLEPTDLERSTNNTTTDRLLYLGTKLNKNIDKSGDDPVQITFTTPTKLVTQQPGTSRLKTK